MLVDNKNFREASHIGEEIMSDPDTAMRSKCLSVHGTVTDGTFTLEKALKLYKVPFDTYIAFVARKHAEEMEGQLRAETKEDEMIFKINLVEKLFEISFASLDKKKVGKLLSILSKFSKEMEDEKLILK